MKNLLEKYDVQVPRYTSYPTVPSWHKTPTSEEWIASVHESLEASTAAWSMYLHVPFCETLCTFCGCNNIITKNHNEEHSYVNLVLKEWQLYKEKAPLLLDRKLKMLHLGGGTPTFLSAENLKALVGKILSDVRIDEEHFEGSIEVDPRRTNKEQLSVLRNLGFNRISLGVQDFNHEVQYLINRIQPYDVTKKITDEARELGYKSVNFDLIYGLPAQSLERMVSTIKQTIELNPDRIAFYSFALVPWIKPAQRLFKDSDLPAANEKRELYEVGREMLLAAGFEEVGMDHFAKPTDALCLANKNKTLHRNFMGYTDQYSDVLLGLGVSSISESKTVFHQNEKVFAKYTQDIMQNMIPTHRGHVLSEQDILRRRQILQLITNYEVKISEQDQFLLSTRLGSMQSDELIEMQNGRLAITSKGKPFLRNICSGLDEYYQSRNIEKPTYSKSI